MCRHGDLDRALAGGDVQVVTLRTFCGRRLSPKFAHSTSSGSLSLCQSRSRRDFLPLGEDREREPPAGKNMKA
jgi:hypothetical protein